MSDYRTSVLWTNKIVPVIKRLPQDSKIEITKWGANYIEFTGAGTKWKLKLEQIEK